MTHDDDRHSNDSSTIRAGVIGAAVGVAAGATAIFFSDKKNREKAAKMADGLKTKTENTLSTMKDKADDMSDKTKTTLSNMKAKVEDVKDRSEEALEKKKKELRKVEAQKK